MYKIDKGIPVPTTRAIRSRAGKYPFPSMSAGESFFVDDEDPRGVRNSAYGWGKRHGAKFHFDMETSPEGVEGIRVWRVA